MKFSGVTILQGVEFSIFLLILNGPYNSAALLPVIQNYTVHCSTVCSVQFISTKLAAQWMSANSDMTLVHVISLHLCGLINECSRQRAETDAGMHCCLHYINIAEDDEERL